MKTAMQELEDWVNNHQEPIFGMDLEIKINELLKKEKEQIIAAVRYGQNNHTASVYDEGELYYIEIYNRDAQFIKSSIPNGTIKSHIK